MNTTWMQTASESGFGLDHLPLGRVEAAGRTQPAVRVGDRVLPLAAAADRLAAVPAELLQADTTSPLLAAGPQVWSDLRHSVQELLASDADAITLTTPMRDVKVLLPFEVADYVDFYSSEHHAMNVGRLFRPDSPALPPNWKHLPIGYHGRSGTVVASGTPIGRPNGQTRPSGSAGPGFGPSERLDVEVEVGFVVGVPSPWGRPVTAEAFTRHVYGVVLVNDWSARDLQAWEYQPLGPFLGKSFATSVGCWITPLAALESARTPGPKQEPLTAVPARSGPVDAGTGSGTGGKRHGGVPTTVRLDLLLPRAATGPHDLQRSLAAHRRPVRVRNRQRAGTQPSGQLA